MQLEPDVQLVTLFTAADAVAASLLAESVRAHMPGAVLHAMSCDHNASHPAEVQPVAAEAVIVDDVSLAELVAAGPAERVLAIAVPAVIRHVLRLVGRPVVYLAPQIEMVAAPHGPLFGDPAAPAELLVARRGGQLPSNDGRRPDDLDLLLARPVSPSVVAALGGETALTRWASGALAAWQRGLDVEVADHLHHLVSQERGVAAVVDAPGLAEGFRTDVDTSKVFVVDFTGFDPRSPHRPLSLPEVARRLADETWYRDRREKLTLASNLPTVKREVVRGVGYDDVMQTRYRRELVAAVSGLGDRPPCPLLEGAAFLAWLAEREYDGPVHVSRYIDEIRAGRPDLLDAFPEVPGRSSTDLIRWVLDHGRHEMDIPVSLLPDRPQTARPATYQQPGVNLAGFLTAELGVGEVARRLAAAMDAAAVPYGTYTFERTVSRQRAQRPADISTRFDTNIVCVNADSMGSFVQSVGPDFSAGRYRVGVWFWETADLPPMFHPAFGNVDELWAASDFVADALQASAPAGLPVIRFPLPIVEPQTDTEFTRASLDIPDDRFVFLFVFDYLSVADRKNPYGLVEAFREAFADGEGPILVVKSINADRRPDDAARLRWFAEGRSDVLLRDGYLAPPAVASLLQSADCFVSLHRSEGFGFNLADAMSLGTPVIATGYSGNLTFMHDNDCVLVPAAETPVGPGQFPYLAESAWADPDLGAAANELREMVERPLIAIDRASAARHRVLRDFSPVATGTFIRNRLAATRSAGHPGRGEDERPATMRQLASSIERAVQRARHRHPA
jgi:glycosyltransferase involved in cell wall biosynthesis